jgi:multiple sugar transport system permease protein
MQRLSTARIAHAVGLILVILFALFPFYWMVTSSLKNQTDLLASPPVWSFVPTLANYQEIFADRSVTNAVINSLIVASATTILSVLLGTPAAFALARYEFRGKAELWFWFISNRMISPIVLALPVQMVLPTTEPTILPISVASPIW